MTYHKFQTNDLFSNRIKTHPSLRFFIYQGSVYYNEQMVEVASRQDDPNNKVRTVLHMSGNQMDKRRSVGGISLYEMNVDRLASDMIYSYKEKDSSGLGFKTVGVSSFQQADIGEIFDASYPLSSSISSDFFNITPETTSSRLNALRNTIDYYKYNSPHYSFTSSEQDPHDRDFSGATGATKVKLISIPSIYYGSGIKKGTVDLKFFMTGTLCGRAQDINLNGELIQTEPQGSQDSGSVVGFVLYREGFIVLTGSALSNNTDIMDYYEDNTTEEGPAWYYFASTGSLGTTYASSPRSSFALEFSGSSYISTVTMLAHARRGELNYSQNPTFIDYYNTSSLHSGSDFLEESGGEIKNLVGGEFSDLTSSFQKITYISKIGIYDEHQNLIAVAKLANPVRKREIDDYTFKLKLDI